MKKFTPEFSFSLNKNYIPINKWRIDAEMVYFNILKENVFYEL